MFRSILILSIVGTCGFSPLLFPEAAKAQTALTRATIESLRNRARLIPQNRSARLARRADVLTPGDVLATATQASADLRFNDRSLARLGEQAVFRFAPGMRSVDLTRGTLLLLVSPGQGRTRVRTPNSAAGIRGSALFVRYNPDTDTTTIGALTNSQIEVFNRDGSDRVELEAGQMAVMVKDRIDGLYNFDLQTFYQTSPLVEDLELTGSETDSGTAPAAVRAEIEEGVASQPPLSQNNAIVNPDFIRMTPVTTGTDGNSGFPEVDASTFELETDAIAASPPPPNPSNFANLSNSNSARSSLLGGEIQITQQRRDAAVGGGGTGGNRGRRVRRGRSLIDIIRDLINNPPSSP